MTIKPDRTYSPTQMPSVLSDVWELIKPQRGLLLLGLLLIFISRGAGLVLPASTKYLVDEVIGKQRVDLLLPLVLAVLAATLVQGVSSYLLTQSLTKSAHRMIAGLRRKVQQHIGRLPVAYFDANKTGSLVSRVMNDVEGIRNLVGPGMVQLVGGLITAVAALGVLLVISPLLTGIALVAILVSSFVLYYAFNVIRPIFRERNKIRSALSGRLTESLAGIRVVKGYHAEDREAEVFSGGVEQLLDNVFRTVTASSFVSLAGTLLMGFGGAVIMYVGAHQILDGTLTLGDFGMFVAFLAFLISPVTQMVSTGTQVTEALAGLDRTREVLHERAEDEDPRRTVALGDIRGEVIFEKVSFAYEVGNPVLHDISFEAHPGTATALVGPSGSGKSTIIGLVAAFYTPSRGTVWVDGVDLSTVRLSSYRTHLGVVLQESFLFDGTIRENVAFGRPGAAEEEILSACRMARVDEFAESLEEAYDTIVGERGVKLSGGQRQRVSIARAILADPRILILDEATSSLDSESEALIQEGLSNLMKGRTTFVIAHRLSTILRSSQILVVEEGRIKERGTHETLYALGGRYFELYNKQHSVEADLFLAPGEGNDVEEHRPEESRNGDDEFPDTIDFLRGK